MIDENYIAVLRARAKGVKEMSNQNQSPTFLPMDPDQVLALLEEREYLLQSIRGLTAHTKQIKTQNIRLVTEMFERSVGWDRSDMLQGSYKVSYEALKASGDWMADVFRQAADDLADSMELAWRHEETRRRAAEEMAHRSPK